MLYSISGKFNCDILFIINNDIIEVNIDYMTPQSTHQYSELTIIIKLIIGQCTYN